jgi:hypothetical protein
VTLVRAVLTDQRQPPLSLTQRARHQRVPGQNLLAQAAQGCDPPLLRLKTRAQTCDATMANNYTSSIAVTVRLAAEGKAWKDWIKQLTN